MVLGDGLQGRLIGLQRSDAREIAARLNSRLRLSLRAPIALLDSAIARASSLGATRGASTLVGQGDTGTTMSAPSGTPFEINWHHQPATVRGATLELEPDSVTIDVLEPRHTSLFWRAITGFELLADSDDGSLVLLGIAACPWRLALRRCPPAGIAERPRSQLHIDLVCDVTDFDKEVDRIVDLGAVRLGPQRTEHFGRGQILLDPDGIVFCHNAYT